MVYRPIIPSFHYSNVERSEINIGLFKIGLYCCVGSPDCGVEIGGYIQSLLILYYSYPRGLTAIFTTAPVFAASSFRDMQGI
jgi:hypothetical protein